ncbi:insulinase family protein [Planctellipticum variicoloris]|nr:insulinase family protein [Planctomycetaceae bacterium SH412]
MLSGWQGWAAAWLVAVGVSVVQGADTVKPMKITEIEGISEYRLDNGLKVLLFPDSSKPTVTVNLTVFVGSRHEGYGEAGMAHLLEHMLFKGTPDHPTIPKALQGRGAEFNGTTWVDRTNYYETLPANDENLEFALRLEADRMMNSKVLAEDLASEMTVVRNEFERGENNPAYVLVQRMMGAAYEWHNYGKSTIGNRADIERVPVESLRRFYKKYYQPDNAMVVVAGRFDEQKALEFIGKYFGEIPKPERVLEPTYTEEPAQDGERTVTLRRVGDVAVVGVVYHIPAGAHPDYSAIDVLEGVLTLQPAGRLYKALVEQKKASSVSGAAYAWHDPGTLRLMAEVATGNTPETVLDTLLDTIDSVVERGVKEEEVERVKQRLLKQREMAAADSAEMAIELSEWQAQGDWRLYFLYRDRIEQVTVKDVDRVARAYLQPSNRTIGLYIPTAQPQRTAVPATPDIVELVKDYKGRESATEGEQFDVSPANIDERTRRSEIGGVSVALLPKKTRGNTVILRLTLRYGTSQSLAGMSTACEFLPALMVRGTKQLSRQQLQDQLDQSLATLGAGGNAGEATFSIQTKRDKLPAVLDLLRQVLREPALPPAELEILKQAHRSDLEQGLTDPQSLAVRAINRKLNPYPPSDVRYSMTLEEELKAAIELDLAAVKKLYSNFLGAQAGQLVVVGDFDPETTMEAVTGMLKGWQAAQPYERISRSGNLDLKAETIRILTPDKANAFYFGGTALPMRDDDPDYAAMVIGNYVFGAGALSSRLGDRIRQKEGLSYGVGSAFRASSLDERATISLYAICNPDNVPKVQAAITEELNRLLKEGITAVELENAAKGYLQRQEVARTEDPALARMLEESLYAGRTMEYYARLESQISKLTPESVVEALRKHVHPDRILVAIAGDFEPKKPTPKDDDKPAGAAK